MKKLLALAAAAFLLSAGAAAAQNASVAAACSAQTLPVGYLNGTLIVQQNGDLCTNASGGGGGGNTTVTATAVAPTYIEGSSTNPVSSGLKGGIRFMPITPAGVNVDLSLPSSIMGLDGSTIMSDANPLAVRLKTGTPNQLIGTVSIDQTTPGTTNNVVVGSSALPTGAATEASLAKLTLGQTTSSAAATGPLVMCASSAAVPTYSGTQVNPVSCDLQGLVRVGGLAQASTTSGQSGVLVQCAVTTAAPTYTTAQTNPFSCDTTGTLRVTGGGVAQASTTSGQSGTLIQGATLTAAPTYTTAQTNPLTMDVNGALRITPMATGGNAAAFQGTNGDALAVASGLTSQVVNGVGRVFNGTSLDRMKGNTAGIATLPNGISTGRWSFAGATGGISNTTTAVTVKAAAGAGLKNCVASLQIATDTLGAATEFAIRDGAAGTVLWRTKLQTTSLPASNPVLQAAVCGTANTLLEVVTLTATVTGGVYVNLQGSIEP